MRSAMGAAGKLTTDYLLIDISNSFVKLAFATTRKIGKSVRLPTSKLTATALRRILRGHKVGAIVVSSVVPKKN
jgi:pantothenate kinase type III